MQTENLPRTLASFIWYFLKKNWLQFGLMQFFCFAWAFDHTLWPYVLKMIIDKITEFSGDRSEMWTFLATPIILAVILWSFIELCFRAGGFLSAKLFPQLEADVRMAMFNYVQKHSHSYFSNHFAGSIANKIGDMTQGITQILHQLMFLFFPVLLAVVISTILFATINAWFALILLSWVVIHLTISLLFAGHCAKLSDEHAQARSTLVGKIVDVLTNISNVRLFARNRYESIYLKKFQTIEREKQQRQLIYIEWMKMALGLVSFLGSFVAINWYMLYSWQHHLITTGDVVFIFNSTWNITMMTWIASIEVPNLFRDIGVCRQAISIIADPHEITDAPDAKPLKVTQGTIKFDNVSFNYQKGHRIFHDKNLIIHAGEKVGLVGYSGSGKSTFVHLILRYFDVAKGAILIDDQDISKVTQDSLHEQIAFIPQDASLFHRTLMENIRYGRLEALDSDVFAAAGQANCTEFIEKNAEGYQALVGERGVKLSGGQRQRISIARAILKDAPILILDEATSALDSVTERLIQESLQELMKGRTSIVIAHRLSTLSGMDRILVFHEGEIIEEGTHHELLAAQGHYANLWEMQAGGFLPDDLEDEIE